MSQVNSHIDKILQTLPAKPGVYQHLDDEGKVLYVGKAKDLKKRVSSYFKANIEHGKTRVLVKKIRDIKIIVTDSEIDALLLENSLIKEKQPRYNILLKDDKTYPWICVKNERFPRIFSTRNPVKDGSLYFGPYASGKVIKTLLGLIRQLYTLRTCNFSLDQESIDAGKYKVCLEYHIKNCLGPCEGKQREGDYNKDIESAKQILKGHFSVVKRILKQQMEESVQNLLFEEAQAVKEKLDLLQNYQSRSTVVSQTITNVDVYTALIDAEYGYVNFLRIVEGAVVHAHTVEVKRKLEETESELLETILPELHQKFNTGSSEILVNHPVDLALPDVKFRVPQRGEKVSLLELSLKNARYFRLEKLKTEQIVDPDRHTNRIMNQMKIDLRMPVEPRYIECFDNSNIQGTNPVSACVVFRDGKPSKKDYRHFDIKTVEGPDDFASMEEVIFRRYKRLVEEEKPLPDLIIIDGGKGQLSSALKSLEKLDLRGKISIIGIAKRLEEIYFPGDSVPLYLDKRSESLKIIQHARNEAHRFGITHHRKKRSKSGLKSELDNIKGIGPTAVKALFQKFKSVKEIKQASEDALSEVIGKAKAKLILSYFKNQ